MSMPFYYHIHFYKWLFCWCQSESVIRMSYTTYISIYKKWIFSKQKFAEFNGYLACSLVHPTPRPNRSHSKVRAHSRQRIVYINRYLICNSIFVEVLLFGNVGPLALFVCIASADLFHIFSLLLLLLLHLLLRLSYIRQMATGKCAVQWHKIHGRNESFMKWNIIKA